MVNLTETWQQCLTDNVYSNDTVHISVSTKQLRFCSYLVRSPKAYDFNCLFAEICKEKANENSYKYVWVGCGGFFGASLKRVRDPSEWISNRELYVRTYSNTLFCLSCRYCVHMTPPVFCVFSLTPRILLFSFAIFSLLGCLIPIASERCVCVYGDGSSYLARCEQT